MQKLNSILTLWIIACFAFSPLGLAEPAEEYPGIQDPFQDPFKDNSVQIEQSPIESATQPEGHTGTFRNVMLGLGAGAGIFTGGLGLTTAPAGYYGLRLTYFFSPEVAIELAGHFGDFVDSIQGTQTIDVATSLIPLTIGLKYYFGNPKSKAIQFANPHVGIGGGSYLRSQRPLNSTAIQNADNTQFGAWAMIGIEVPVVQQKLYLGLDLRYHLIFFIDEDGTLEGIVAEGSRAGDFFAPVVTLNYNF